MASGVCYKRGVRCTQRNSTEHEGLRYRRVSITPQWREWGGGSCAAFQDIHNLKVGLDLPFATGSIIWECAALHISVAFPACHLCRDGGQDARRILDAPHRPFRVFEFFLGVHRMSKKRGAFQDGGAFPKCHFSRHGVLSFGSDAFPSPGTYGVPCQSCISVVPLQLPWWNCV